MRSAFTVPILLLLLARASSGQTSAGSAEGVFSAVSPSVVVVETFDSGGRPLSLGSGVVVATNRVVTNFHVVQGATKVRLRQKGEAWSARVLRVDRAHDLCLLTASIPRSAVSLRASNALRVGERVYAIGAPEGLELTLSDGLIAALRQVSDALIIQTSAPISHGSSGGGLFDASGHLVGITTSQIVNGQNLNFAMPTEWLAGLISVEVPATKAPATGVKLSDSSENPDYRAIQLWIAFQDQETSVPRNPGEEVAVLPRCDEMIRLSPKFPGGWVCRADVYLSVSNIEKALPAAREAVRVAPKNAEAWGILAWVLYHRRDFEECEKAVSESIRLAPALSLPWYVRGSMSSAQGHFEEAIGHFRNALDRDPENGHAWRGMAEAFEGSGDHPRALECVREAIRVKPDEYMNWSELGILYLKNEPDKAVEPFRHAFGLAPKNSLSCLVIAKALSKADRLDEALVAADDCAARFERCASCLYVLTEVYCLKGDRDRALEIYSELRALDKGRADEIYKKCLGRSF